MAKKTVELSRKYEGHDGFFDKIVFREPTYKEIFIEGLGRPQEWQRTDDGKALLITFPAVIDEYVQRLAVEPGAESLHVLNAVDSIRVERAITGFFLEPIVPETSPPTSSSGSDGTRDASAA